MRIASMCVGLTVAAGATAAVVGVRIDSSGLSGAAIAQQRSHGAQSLDRVMGSSQAVDTAYASGNAAEAETRFRQARAARNRVSPRISAREARKAQLVFDALGNQLRGGPAATQVRATVEGMLNELREDVERELR